MISESVLQLLKVKLKGNSTKSNLGFHLYNKNNIMETIFFTRPSDIETSLGTWHIYFWQSLDRYYSITIGLGLRLINYKEAVYMRALISKK